MKTLITLLILFQVTFAQANCNSLYWEPSRRLVVLFMRNPILSTLITLPKEAVIFVDINIRKHNMREASVGPNYNWWKDFLISNNIVRPDQKQLIFELAATYGDEIRNLLDRGINVYPPLNGNVPLGSFKIEGTFEQISDALRDILTIKQTLPAVTLPPYRGGPHLR